MLIYMRNAMMAGGKLSAKSYVQDGLVAMWDGIENAGWGTHDPNATTWKDVVHGAEIPLASGMSFGDMELVFDNRSTTADTSTALDNSIFSAVSTEFTVEFVEKVTKSYSGFGASSNMYLGYYSYHQMDRNRTLTCNDNTTYKQYAGVPYGTPYNCSIVRNIAANTMVVMENGSILTATSLGGRVCSLQNILTMTNGWNGNVSSYNTNNIRIYSRALTADEIAANYAVDKARFNLPDAT